MMKCELVKGYKGEQMKLVTPKVAISSAYITNPDDTGKYSLNLAFNPDENKEHADFIMMVDPIWLEYANARKGEAVCIKAQLTPQQALKVKPISSPFRLHTKENEDGTSTTRHYLNIKLQERDAERILINDLQKQPVSADQLVAGSEIDLILETWGLSASLGHGLVYPQWNVRRIRVHNLGVRVVEDFDDYDIIENDDDDIPF